MTAPLVISIDAMGGDHGPAVIIPGLAEAAADWSAGQVRFLLHGDEAVLNQALGHVADLAAISDVRGSNGVVSMDTKPAHAMRRGKGTSMWNALESLRSGEANACVSAGNTGALMAVSRLLLRTAGGLDRPALVANWPTMRGVSTVLDAGANIVCDDQRLVQFAVMGAAYHRALYKTPRPTVGVLNVGAEAEKGNEAVRGADRLLRMADLPLEYRGFVEGDDIAKGAVDVVVTDGFTGNVAVKTGEGLGRFFMSELRNTFTQSTRAKIGAWIARPALRAMRARLDPGALNGGLFLGLNGIVVKSHGSADSRGFANAVRLTVRLSRSSIVGEMREGLEAASRLAHAPMDALATPR